MVLPLGTIIGGLGKIAGVAGALGGGRTRTQQSAEVVPEWQKKMIQDQYRRQNELAGTPLAQGTQQGINRFMGLDTVNQLGQLAAPDSVLGQRARGDFIGSDAYKRVLDDSNQRIREQFEQTEMPGVLGRFSSAGRLGSPSMMRSAEQAQAGLARGIAQNEAQLLQNERANQMKAVGQMGNIYSAQNQIAGARARLGLALDPSEIARRRLAAQNQLAMGNYGRRGMQQSYYNPMLQAGGALGKLGTFIDEYGNEQRDPTVYSGPNIRQPVSSPWLDSGIS